MLNFCELLKTKKSQQMNQLTKQLLIMPINLPFEIHQPVIRDLTKHEKTAGIIETDISKLK